MGGHAPGSALVASRVGALLRWEVGGTRLEVVVACMLEMMIMTLILVEEINQTYVASGPQANTWL